MRDEVDGVLVLGFFHDSFYSERIVLPVLTSLFNVSL
jgi:hypothetical protein